jgi:hypothetical protein
MTSEDELRRQIRENAKRIRDLGDAAAVPRDVVQAQVGDLLNTRRGRESLYRVVRVPSPRWLIVLNLWSGIETRRKADDFELWARP